jgi:hypothetical protein
MNCKPGDLATVIGGSRWSGWIVEVLYAAPQGTFNLPDGYPCNCNILGNVWKPDDWVIRSLCSQFDAPLANGKTRPTWYGVGNDSKLRPLPSEKQGVGAREFIEIEKCTSPSSPK